jgi:hypothetical protein
MSDSVGSRQLMCVVQYPTSGVPMKYDILGEVERSDAQPFDAVAKVRYDSLDIKVGISRDDQPFETALELAADVVRRLPELDNLAKRVAVADLRQTYNNGWNEYDEAQEDGTFKAVSNPQLSEAEFEAKLSLNAINVTGDRVIDFFYDDEKMFWGHSIVVTSLNGVNFSDAHAELFG